MQDATADQEIHWQRHTFLAYLVLILIDDVKAPHLHRTWKNITSNEDQIKAEAVALSYTNSLAAVIHAHPS